MNRFVSIFVATFIGLVAALQLFRFNETNTTILLAYTNSHVGDTAVSVVRLAVEAVNVLNISAVAVPSSTEIEDRTNRTELPSPDALLLKVNSPLPSAAGKAGPDTTASTKTSKRISNAARVSEQQHQPLSLQTNSSMSRGGGVVLNKCLVEANKKYIMPLSKQWDIDRLPQFGSIVRAPRRVGNIIKPHELVWYATFSIKRFKYLPSGTNKTKQERLDLFDRWMIASVWYCNNEKGKRVGAGKITRGDMIVIECADNSSIEPLSEIRVWNTTYHVGAHVQCELESPLLKPVGNVTGGLFLFGKMIENVLQVLPWMEYHRMLGVDHYYVYLMKSYTEEEEQMLPNLPYVTYVPFLVMDPAQIQRRRYGGSRIFGFQIPQMHDMLYRARAAGFQWLFYNDADEYIQLMEKETLSDYLSEDVGYLVLKCRNFGNAAVGQQGRFLRRKPSFDIDYVFREPQSDKNKGRTKCLVRPDRIDLYNVHSVNLGDPGRILDPEKEIRLNHYKSPQLGVYGLEKNEVSLRDTSLRDKFRDALQGKVNHTLFAMSIPGI